MDRIPDHEGIDLESLSRTRTGSKGVGECGCTGPWAQKRFALGVMPYCCCVEGFCIF